MPRNAMGQGLLIDRGAPLTRVHEIAACDHFATQLLFAEARQRVARARPTPMLGDAGRRRGGSSTQAFISVSSSSSSFIPALQHLPILSIAAAKQAISAWLASCGVQ